MKSRKTESEAISPFGSAVFPLTMLDELDLIDFNVFPRVHCWSPTYFAMNSTTSTPTPTLSNEITSTHLEPSFVHCEFSHQHITLAGDNSTLHDSAIDLPTSPKYMDTWPPDLCF